MKELLIGIEDIEILPRPGITASPAIRGRKIKSETIRFKGLEFSIDIFIETRKAFLIFDLYQLSKSSYGVNVRYRIPSSYSINMILGWLNNTILYDEIIEGQKFDRSKVGLIV